MTNNQELAKEYLSRIRNVESNINEKLLELEALRYKASGACGIDYSKDRVQSSAKNYMEMAVADIVRIEEEIRQEYASIDEIKGQAYRIVRKIQFADQRTLIEWYYLNGCKAEETFLKMNIGERTFYYLRDDALESFGTLLQCE